MTAGHNGISWPKNRISKSAWGSVLLAVALCGTYATHAADEAGAAVGLRGVLPEGVPVELIAAIAQLPENWKSWGEGLSADLATLYEKAGLDVASQRAAIAALEGRRKTLSKAESDPRYRPITTALVTISGSLKRRLDIAKAALDTLEAGPGAKAARVAAARNEVAQAAASLDRFLASTKGGAAWDKYLEIDQVRGQLADDGKSAVVLAGVQNKLRNKNAITDAGVRDFMQKSQIVAYEQAVDNYLAIRNAPEPARNNPELRKALGELLTAIDAYEAAPSSGPAAQVRSAYEAVRKVAPDGGDRISAALRTNYFNFNLRLVAHEGFLNRLIGQRRQESGQVVDYVLGANVYGNQTTVTDAGIDVKPSANGAQFDVTVNGQISSSTVGVTDQAQIYTQGNHSFRAEKRVSFNGKQFWTQPARIGVNANNTTTGADTNINIPLFGGIARNIAINKAEEMRGESEAIAASRVQSNVLPKFNAEVDKEFGATGKLNSEVAERRAALAEQQLGADAEAWSSTETELRAASRVMGGNELGGSDPNPILVWGKGATLLVHESLMNNASDRMNLNGQTLSDDELKARIEENLTKLLGRDIKFGDNNPAPQDAETKNQSLVFDKTDAIRFQAGGGMLTVTLRVGVKQEGKEDIPTQVVTVPLAISVDVKNVVIEPGSIQVSAAERGGSPTTQLARAGVIRKKIEAAFPRRDIDRVATIARDGRKVNLAVTRVKALDGWLSVTFE